MRYSARHIGAMVALLGVLGAAGCHKSDVGADGFPPPQPEPAAAKAAAAAAAARNGGAPPGPPSKPAPGAPAAKP